MRIALIGFIVATGGLASSGAAAAQGICFPGMVITRQPQDQTIASGATATLTVSIQSGSPPPYQYDWADSFHYLGSTFNGAYTTVPLTSSIRFYVVVSPVACPQFWVSSEPATITVLGTPAHILTGPQSQLLGPEMAATLSVDAIGPGPQTYQWYVGPSGNTSTPIAGATASSYTTPVTTRPTNYWVRVSNAYGPADSDAATIALSTPPTDFNGDGQADIAWRNMVTGENSGWMMNGVTVSSSGFLPTIADTDWEIKGVGRFDGNGRTDFIWRNKTTGQNILWLMDGLTVASAAFLPTIADTNWDINGVGDFDGDHRADVVWRNGATGQNIAWLMNGTTVAFAAFLPTIADTHWDIKGIGDFDGDGRADVIWRHDGTGENVGWLMNGAAVSFSAFLPAIADTDWEIKGAGDFDADGKSDVILRNRATGQTVGWLMNGLSVSSSAFLPTGVQADLNWEIKGVADYSHDGKADVAWRNKSTGENVIWRMNGLVLSGLAFPPTIADTNWDLVR